VDSLENFMRSHHALCFLSIALLVACNHPDLEAYRKSPAPVVVNLEIPSEVPDREVHARDYAAALRAKLATRLEVVPDGVTAPANADRLNVVITGYRLQEHGPSPGAVGVATGVGVGILSAASGSRTAAWDGFFWGMFAGSVAADVKEREARLGFRPMRVEARVFMTRADGKTVLADFDIDPRKVYDAMEPLRRSEEDDAERISEVEAKALARVIVRELDEILELRVQEPRWYRDPAAKEERPAPKTEEAPKTDDAPKPEAAPEKKEGA
jgi:hypothetical protein